MYYLCVISTITLQGKDYYYHILDLRKLRLREIRQYDKVPWLLVAKPETNQVV